MARKERPTTDENGELIVRFSNTMQNLGMARAADELVNMMESGRWQKFVQGFQTFEFLPGEFDYFLTQQGVTRDMVIAIRDVEAKARLEDAMDERKTGEPGYRRPILQAREEIPKIPGRPIVPFGYTKKDAKLLVNGSGVAEGAPWIRVGGHEPALGDRLRRWKQTGKTTPPAEQRPKWERLASSAVRLDDDALEALHDAIKAEKQNRRRATKK